MSYIVPPTEITQTRRRRILINGKSGSRKTTSVLTFPRPIAVINYPGELGWDTLPDGDPEVTKLVWAEDEGKKLDAMKVIKEIEQTALKLIAEGKLSREGKTIIIFSSELPEVMNICDSIYLLYDGSLKSTLRNSCDVNSEQILHVVTGGE